MIKHRYLNLALAAFAAILFSPATPAAHRRHATTPTSAPADKGKTAEPAATTKPVETTIEYKQLETNIGAELAIETTFNTVRRGTLVHYTNPGLTIRLGPEAGSIELEVPAETIRHVSIVTPAPQTATPPQENSSAKKN